MAVKRLLVAFHAGLCLSVGLLLLGLLRRPGLLAGLVWVGIAHVLTLTVLGMRAGPRHAERVAATLHRAGFLHTLMGAAVGFLALAHAMRAGGDQVQATLALASIGTALVPHFLALWAGHAVDAGGCDEAASPAELAERLAAELAAHLELMRQVRRQLEQGAADASAELVASFRRNLRFVEDETQGILDLLPAMRGRIEGLSRSLSEAVVVPVTETASASREALAQLAGTARDASASLEETREYVAQVAGSMREVADGLRAVSGLVHQLTVVQGQLSRLVESALFRSGAAA